MRILTLNSNLKGVGTYVRCFHFSRELARAGHEVTMATVSRTSPWRPRSYFKRAWIGEHASPSGDGPWVRMIEGPGLGYKWLPGWGSGPLDIAVRTRETTCGNYDAVYGFEYQPNVSWPVYLARPFRRFRYFSDWCDWHSGESNHMRGWQLAHRVDAFFEESIRFLAEKITVISKTLLERAVTIGIPRERIVHLREGVDTDYMRPFPQREVRTRLGLPEDRPILLSVADGDMKRVVRIYNLLFQQRRDALAVIIGNVGREVITLARELGLEDRLRFPGWVSDEEYPQYFSAADVCLLPLEDGLCNHARFPAKLLDFLAAGRPVVTNRVGEAGAFVECHQVGAAVEQDDPALAAGAAHLLDDPQLRETMGSRARTLMTAEWDWRTRTREIASVVEGAA